MVKSDGMCRVEFVIELEANFIFELLFSVDVNVNSVSCPCGETLAIHMLKAIIWKGKNGGQHL